MASVAEAREMLGLSVRALRGALVQLCAETGYPVFEERMYGEGEYAGMRRPTVYDIKQAVLLDATASAVCTRDGLQGAALVDVLEALAGPGSVGRATLMLS